MAKRREWGEGSIYQRGTDGLWIGTLELEPVGGTRRRKTVNGHSRAEVKDKLAALRAQQVQGQALVQDERRTLAAYLPQWLEGHAVRPATRRLYHLQITKYLVPELGHIRLNKLTPVQVRAFLARLTTQGRGARTIQQCHAILRAAIGQAHRDGLVSRNVLDLVPAPTARPAERPFLTAGQVATLLTATEGTRWGALWAVACLTGLRRGEVLALRWADVDWDAGTVRVTAALDARTRTRQEPKTASSRRTVPLAPRVVAALRAHRKTQAAERLQATEWDHHDLIFCTHQGRPLAGENIGRAFHQALAAAGLPAVRFHDLRHTFATLMAEANVSPRVTQELLGHATLSTTMAIYTHVSQSSKAGAVEALDRAVAGPDGYKDGYKAE